MKQRNGAGSAGKDGQWRECGLQSPKRVREGLAEELKT